jgi:hypothetical protein
MTDKKFVIGVYPHAYCSRQWQGFFIMEYQKVLSHACILEEDAWLSAKLIINHIMLEKLKS